MRRGPLSHNSRVNHDRHDKREPKGSLFAKGPRSRNKRDNESVHVGLKRALRHLPLLVPALLLAADSQATIEDTGSTNRPGLRVTLDDSGRATVEPRTGETQHVKLPHDLCLQFMRDLKAVGPLADLPARHCVKSVSFGSRLFVEFNGDRSPDLSCPVQQESAEIENLKKDIQTILQAARSAADIPAHRAFTVPAQKMPRS